MRHFVPSLTPTVASAMARTNPTTHGLSLSRRWVQEPACRVTGAGPDRGSDEDRIYRCGRYITVESRLRHSSNIDVRDGFARR